MEEKDEVKLNLKRDKILYKKRVGKEKEGEQDEDTEQVEEKQLHVNLEMKRRKSGKIVRMSERVVQQKC